MTSLFKHFMASAMARFVLSSCDYPMQKKSAGSESPNGSPFAVLVVVQMPSCMRPGHGGQ